MRDENEIVPNPDDVLSGGADEADIAGASPTTRTLFQRGSKMADVDFSEIENRRRQATEEKLAAIRRGHAALMQQRPDNTEALLALARGFLSPTRTGSFGESLGLAAGEAGPAMQRQRQLEEQRRQQAAQYEAQIAQVRAQGVDDEYRALLDRAKRGETLMTRAGQLAAAEARAREQAEARRENMDLRRDIAQQGADARTSGQMMTATGYLDEATLARLAQTDPRAVDMKPGVYIFQYNKADPANSMRIISQAEPKKQEQPQKLSATEQKEIIESMDAISAGERAIAALGKASGLNDSAYAGFFAGARAALVANARHAVGASPSKAADNTRLYETIVTEQALSQLKSIFGAAPTEGERKILTEMQASVDKTPAQRKAILERAVEAANARIESERRKVGAIKTGEYKSPSAPASVTPGAGLSEEAEKILLEIEARQMQRQAYPSKR